MYNVMRIWPPLSSTTGFFLAKIGLAFKCYTDERKEESELIYSLYECYNIVLCMTTL